MVVEEAPDLWQQLHDDDFVDVGGLLFEEAWIVVDGLFGEEGRSQLDHEFEEQKLRLDERVAGHVLYALL